MDETTSLSLIQRVRINSDDTSWRTFVDLYSKWVERWLQRRGLQPQDAEDVRQEVLTVILREIPRFDHVGRKGAFRSWLRAVTANRLKAFVRAKSKGERSPSSVRFEAVAEQLEDPASDLSRVWSAEHDRHVIESLLALVSSRFHPRSLDAFQRVILQGEPARDVATDLEMSVNSVRIAQSRVLRALRELGNGLID